MLTDASVAAMADLFRLLGDTTRLRIILCCLDEAVPVGHIAGRLGLSQSLVSHHLRLLRAARLVRHERRGKSVLYQAADDHVRTVLRDMIDHTHEFIADAPAAALSAPSPESAAPERGRRRTAKAPKTATARKSAKAPA